MKFVYRDRYDWHDGPIMFCDAAVRRSVWAAAEEIA